MKHQWDNIGHQHIPTQAMVVIPGCDDEEEGFCAVVEDAYSKVGEVEPTPLRATAEQLSKCMSFERQAGKSQEKQPCYVGIVTVEHCLFSWYRVGRQPD